MAKVNELNFMVGGFAGQGVRTVGDAFGRLCVQAGLHVFVNLEYPSNIKGEHNHSQIMVSERPVHSLTRPVDLLLALDAKTVLWHAPDLRPGGALIYDSKNLERSPIDPGLTGVKIERDDILVVDLPLLQIAREVGGGEKMLNSMGLGVVQGLLRFDFEELAAMLRASLAKLGEEKVRQNLEGARRAFDLAHDQFAGRFDVRLERREGPGRMILTGNEALGMGAVKAGLKFFAAYPMTPASSILSFMSKHAREFGLISILPEDEISAVGMAVGAAYAGVRAMTATSGGGFCLMCEHLGLAAMCEIPIVIVEAQRPGPATGLPTRTAQGDLKFVLSAHQDEFARVVIAPGDPVEAFRWGFEAFNIAERVQTPVILLMDKHLSESGFTCEPFRTDGMTVDRGLFLSEEELAAMPKYKRYAVTESGVSPRSRPGVRGGAYLANGNEHNQYGHISEDSRNRSAQVEKRLRKLKALDVSEFGACLHGDAEADVTLVGWGSTKCVVHDAMKVLNERGVRCNFLQIIFIEPFPWAFVTRVLNQAKKTILIENNATAQLADVVCEKIGIVLRDRVLKYDGRMFFRDELADRIEEFL
jgi:2-oxoglutarate ferredoxin oxidoreductase subunit alpha